MANETERREAILAALAKWIGQRSGIEAGNYIRDWRDADGIAALREDQNTIRRDGADARRMLAYVRAWSVDPRHLESAFKDAFSGRLSWNGERLSYCTGQYFCTEYRAAACAVLATAIWRHWRDDCHVDDVRARARKEFGRGIGSRRFR